MENKGNVESVCPSCGFSENQKDAHYCGICGRNIGGKDKKWYLYNSTKGFVIPNDFYFSTIGIIMGICLVALPIIEYTHPEILGNIPSYKESLLAKIVWLIVTIISGLIGTSVCIIGVTEVIKNKGK